MEALDHRLLAFHNAVRHLGSSVGISAYAVALRERFREVLHSFRNHSSIAFPALRQSAEEPFPNIRSMGDQGEGDTTPELGSLSKTLETLACDLEKFLDVRSRQHVASRVLVTAFPANQPNLRVCRRGRQHLCHGFRRRYPVLGIIARRISWSAVSVHYASGYQLSTQTKYIPRSSQNISMI